MFPSYDDLSIPSTERLALILFVLTIFPFPCKKNAVSHMYTPSSVHRTRLMVSCRYFSAMLPVAVATMVLEYTFGILWPRSFPILAKLTTVALGLLLSFRNITTLFKVRIPTLGGSHSIVTVPPLAAASVVRISFAGVIVIKLSVSAHRQKPDHQLCTSILKSVTRMWCVENQKSNSTWSPQLESHIHAYCIRGRNASQQNTSEIQKLAHSSTHNTTHKLQAQYMPLADRYIYIDSRYIYFVGLTVFVLCPSGSR